MILFAFLSKECKECARTIPLLNRSTRALDVTLETVMVEDNPSMCWAYKVYGFPTFVITQDDGTEVDRFTGHQTDISLEAHFRRNGIINEPKAQAIVY